MALGDLIPRSLDETTKAIAATLSWPNNLGIELRPVRLRTRPETALLAVFVQGVADEERVRSRVLEPLVRAVLEHPEAGPLLPQHLDGGTALFFHEAQEAVLVQSEGLGCRPCGIQQPVQTQVSDMGLLGRVRLAETGSGPDRRCLRPDAHSSVRPVHRT
jgi:hypothetical protein